MTLLTASLSGCYLAPGYSCDKLECTAIFAMVTVTVVDANDQPVDGLATVTTYTPTETVVRTSQPLGNGVYVVVDDNVFADLQFIAGDNHPFHFEVMGPNGPAAADFVVEAGDCVCHVAKLMGPDTLVLP